MTKQTMDVQGEAIRAEIMMIPLNQISPSPFNPRKIFDKDKMASLIESVKVKGILDPLFVRPSSLKDGSIFELVDGERRYRAATEIGLEAIPCIVRELSDTDARELQIITFIQHEGLSPIEEAESYQALIANNPEEYDVAKVAKKIGKSASYVYQRLKLLELVAPAQAALRAGDITAAHAVLIARLEPEAQEQALQEIMEPIPDFSGEDEERGKTVASVRATAAIIKGGFYHELGAAPWDVDSASLLSSAGPCSSCPKNTALKPELYPDFKVSTCMDGACWKAKLLGFLNGRRAEAKQTEAAKAGRYVELTEDDYHIEDRSNKLIKARQDWQPAAAACDHAHVGVVVEGDKNLGKILYVCLDRYCKKHWGEAAWERPTPLRAMVDSTRVDFEKQRKLKDEALRLAVDAVVAKTMVPLSDTELRLVATNLWFDLLEMGSIDAIVQSEGWPIASDAPLNNYEQEGLKQIGLAGGERLARMVMRLSYYLWIRLANPDKSLAALVKANKLNLKKLMAAAKVNLFPEIKSGQVFEVDPELVKQAVELHSGSAIPEGRLAGVLKFSGRQWACTSSLYEGEALLEVGLNEVQARSAWKGAAGVALKCKGEEYVLGGLRITLKPKGGVPSPDKSKATVKASRPASKKAAKKAGRGKTGKQLQK